MKSVFKLSIIIIFTFLYTGYIETNIIMNKIERTAKAYDIPNNILTNLIKNESNFRVKIKSKMNSNGTYDLGIMQFNSKYVEYFAKKYNSGKKFNPLNANQSIKVGARYLKHLHVLTGSWEKALMAYNCGLSRVRKNTIPQSTINYAQRILMS